MVEIRGLILLHREISKQQFFIAFTFQEDLIISILAGLQVTARRFSKQLIPAIIGIRQDHCMEED
jgi:hypothetical protein